MKKSKILLMIIFVLMVISTFATNDTTSTEAVQKTSGSGGVDWFEILLLIGYLGGVFVLLPIVVYTNFNEHIFSPGDHPDKINIDNELTLDERNARSVEILERIEEKLTPVKGENDEDLITITKGGQAKFVKRGLDYIKKHLDPDDEQILARVQEFEQVYHDRVSRVFTGSYWIIACSIGVGLLTLFTAGINTFLIIHILGLVFYILSSRTTLYGVEKRMKWIGGINSGMVAGIFAALFAGMGTSYYKKYSDGSREFDGESTLSNMGIILLFIVIIALILGFFAVLLGVLNFIMNYSTSFLLPFKKEEQWYKDNFELAMDQQEVVQ
ncbi:MAG: hypothetical protein ACOCYO_03195 [Bacteroidota bacterium]